MQNHSHFYENTDPERYDFLASIATGLLFVVPLLVVKWLEFKFDWNISKYGLYPRSIEGLVGIFTFPFLHADVSHLLSNTSSLFILVSMIRYFFPDLLWRITPVIFLVSGIGTWAIGREAYHIGASGMVYGYGFAIFAAGIFSKNWRLLALSFLMVFLYGSMFWGVFPMEEKISWEGHLSGAIGGILSIFMFKSRLPPPPIVFEEDDEEDSNNSNVAIMPELPKIKKNTTDPTISINYVYKSPQSEEIDKKKDRLNEM